MDCSNVCPFRRVGAEVYASVFPEWKPLPDSTCGYDLKDDKSNNDKAILQFINGPFRDDAEWWGVFPQTSRSGPVVAPDLGKEAIEREPVAFCSVRGGKFVYDFGTVESRRRQGLGFLLGRFIINHYRNKNNKNNSREPFELHLIVEKTNVAAIRLYSRLGFSFVIHCNRTTTSAAVAQPLPPPRPYLVQPADNKVEGPTQKKQIQCTGQ